MADSKHTLTIKLEEIAFPLKDDPRRGGGAESQPVSTFSEQMKELHSQARAIQGDSNNPAESYQSAFQQAVQAVSEQGAEPEREKPRAVNFGEQAREYEKSQQTFTDVIKPRDVQLTEKAKVTDFVPEADSGGISHIIQTIGKTLQAPFKMLANRGRKNDEVVEFSHEEDSDEESGGGEGIGGAGMVAAAAGGPVTLAAAVFVEAIGGASEALQDFAAFLEQSAEEIQAYSPELIGAKVETELDLLAARIGRANSAESSALVEYEESKRGLLTTFEETKSTLTQVMAPLMVLAVEFLNFILEIINIIIKVVSVLIGMVLKALYYILNGLDYLAFGAIPNEWIAAIGDTADKMLAVMEDPGPQEVGPSNNLALWLGNVPRSVSQIMNP
tara:strand:- start:168 stop:1328 length:1161 start_codon:yes stop_codon:yes gene_type:complete